jgi:hypothetical protein
VKDEQVLLVTHTDGPCISQDNGALGILGVLSSISELPKGKRNRTLLIFMDNRHFLPGMEYANREQDWFYKHPEKQQSIVTYVAMEHLGQLEYRETEDGIEPTGLPEVTWVYTANNQHIIDSSIKAVNDNQLPRTLIKCVDRPGVHGEPQGVWMGKGIPSHNWDLPGFGMLGILGGYWTTRSGIDMFDAELFCKQVNVVWQVTKDLMDIKLENLEKS